MWVNCPQCGKPVEWRQENPNRPFCSARCKLIDLGEWAGGNRYIAGERADSAETAVRQDDFESADDV
ncbi:DNA gyrase inhibitor YacG [Methylothermus subterraneus]